MRITVHIRCERVIAHFSRGETLATIEGASADDIVRCLPLRSFLGLFERETIEKALDEIEQESDLSH